MPPWHPSAPGLWRSTKAAKDQFPISLVPAHRFVQAPNRQPKVRPWSATNTPRPWHRSARGVGLFMRTFKRSVSILILSGALAAASQAGQVHGQPLPEQSPVRRLQLLAQHFQLHVGRLGLSQSPVPRLNGGLHDTSIPDLVDCHIPLQFRALASLAAYSVPGPRRCEIQPDSITLKDCMYAYSL